MAGFRHVITATTAILAACGGSSAQIPAEEARATSAGVDAAATITPAEMLERITFLSSDELRGRDTPSAGLEAAARYIAAEFERLGIRPAGDEDGYLQRYPYVPSSPAGATTDTAYPANVAGFLPGSDAVLRDTYVIISAHYDHVGTGRPVDGDSIYNGADDNASGTSALLELAEAFAALPSPPARSVLFLAVSGEEKGLLGSAYYAANPTVPLDAIVANINIDMIARNSPDSIVVIGQEYSSLGPLVMETAENRPELGLTVVRDPWPEQRFFFRSDHYNFAKNEVPAIFFFAGVHEDYHRPSDEIDEIDAGKAARVARLIFHTARAIAEDAEPPRWTEDGLAEVRALTR